VVNKNEGAEGRIAKEVRANVELAEHNVGWRGWSMRHYYGLLHGIHSKLSGILSKT